MQKKLSSIPLKNIVITDQVWNPYIDLVKDVIIPYQWKILNDSIEGIEPSHCIHNLKIAAGEAEGEFQGAVFQDTDVAKWLEAVAYSLETHPNPELERLADETIDLIGRAQQKDGYLNTYFTIKEPTLRFKNLQEGHELYTAGHMIEAAVAYYEATEKKQFLDIVSRMVDLICTVFGPEEDKCHGYPGHQEIELALFKLYKVTEKKHYLDLAKYFIDRRGVGENYFLIENKIGEKKRIFPEFAAYDPRYSQSHLPVREQTTAEGHAVRAVYMYCAMADLAYEYEDKELLEACKTIWKNLVYKRMYITGGIGSSGLLERFTTDYDLPNDCNYAETCASIGLALFGKRMASITKNAMYMDIVEKALYNTVLSGIAMDGKKFFYVNPLEVWPENCISRTAKEHVAPVRQTWFGVACCPPNIARTLASLGQYIYFTEGDSLYVNLYISNHMNLEFDDGTVEIRMQVFLLGEGHIEFEIRSTRKKETELAFRIPTYGTKFQILEQGISQQNLTIEQGYAKITRLFANTQLTISFEQPAVFVHANPQVRADTGKTAIVKGSTVYCLEETDNTDNLAAIYVDTKQELIEQYEPELLNGVVTVSFMGKKIKPTGWNEEELYGEKAVEFEEISLKAVPYRSWNNRAPGEMIVWMKELL